MNIVYIILYSKAADFLRKNKTIKKFKFRLFQISSELFVCCLASLIMATYLYRIVAMLVANIPNLDTLHFLSFICS